MNRSEVDVSVPNGDEDEQFCFDKLWIGVRRNDLIGVSEMDDEQFI